MADINNVCYFSYNRSTHFLMEPCFPDTYRPYSRQEGDMNVFLSHSGIYVLNIYDSVEYSFSRNMPTIECLFGREAKCSAGLLASMPWSTSGDIRPTTTDGRSKRAPLDGRMPNVYLTSSGHRYTAIKNNTH